MFATCLALKEVALATSIHAIG